MGVAVARKSLKTSICSLKMFTLGRSYAVVGGVVVVELDLAQALRGPLVEEEGVVGDVVSSLRDLGVLCRG